MKTKITSTIFILINSIYAICQTPPQGNFPSSSTNARARAAWYRGGNLPTNTNPPGANLFGTRCHS